MGESEPTEGACPLLHGATLDAAIESLLASNTARCALVGFDQIMVALAEDRTGEDSHLPQVRTILEDEGVIEAHRWMFHRLTDIGGRSRPYASASGSVSTFEHLLGDLVNEQDGDKATPSAVLSALIGKQQGVLQVLERLLHQATAHRADSERNIARHLAMSSSLLARKDRIPAEQHSPSEDWIAAELNGMRNRQARYVADEPSGGADILGGAPAGPTEDASGE